LTPWRAVDNLLGTPTADAWPDPAEATSEESEAAAEVWELRRICAMAARR
jgi:hypothetical protein